ncbi:MAG: tetratricopeptide repeat protein [Leptospirillia bacterium]
MNQGAPHNLPDVSPAFCGRVESAKELLSLVTRERVSCLTGEAGVGKSELAHAMGWLALHEGAFPDGVFRIPMERTGTEATLSGEVARLSAFTEEVEPNKSPLDKEILFIWDQMDAYLAADPNLAATLVDQFTKLPEAHHLVVCRTPVANAPVLTIGPLQEEDAITAFCGHLPDSVSERPDADDKTIREALAPFAGNPLALRIAALWCRPPRNWSALPAGLADSTPAGDGPLAIPLGLAFADMGPESTRLLSLLTALSGGATAQTLASTFGEGWQEPAERLEQIGLARTIAGRIYAEPAASEAQLQVMGPLRSESFLEQAAFYLQQMVNQCKVDNDSGHQARAIAYMTHEWANLRSAFSWAVTRMDSEVIDQEENAELVIDYCTALYHLFTNKGMIAIGWQWMNAAVRAAEIIDNKGQVAMLKDHRGILSVLLDRRDDARADFEAALQTFEELNVDKAVSMAAYHLGQLCYEGGELELAQTHFERALEILRLAQNRAYAAQVGTHLGRIHLLRGNPAAAVEQLNEALGMYEEKTVDIELRVTALISLAEATLAIGEDDESVKRAVEAIQLAFFVNPRFATTALPKVLQTAEIYLQNGKIDLLRTYSEAIGTLIEDFKKLTPQSRHENEFMMTGILFDRFYALLELLPDAFSEDPERAEARASAREKLPEAASELDQFTGGLVQASQWMERRLASSPTG